MITWITNLWLKVHSNKGPRTPSMDISGTGAAFTKNPRLDPLDRFIPLRNLTGLGSEYLEGYTYTVVEGNDSLKKLMDRWYRKGWVLVEQEEAIN